MSWENFHWSILSLRVDIPSMLASAMPVPSAAWCPFGRAEPPLLPPNSQGGTFVHLHDKKWQ